MPGIGLLGTMEMARNAMQTARQGAEVTGHNLANASNPAYSRQRVKIESAATIDTAQGSQGTGSKVAQFEAIRNKLIEDQIVSERSVTGYLDTKQRALQQAEVALGQVIDRHTLNEGGDADQFGIAEGLTDFFGNLSALSASPADNAERQNMLYSAQKLADKFNTVDRRLSALRISLNDDVKTLVDDLNTALNTVSRLSINIGKSEVSEIGQSNELRDQRQKALQDLSELVNFKTSFTEEGGLNVTVNDISFINDNAIVDSFSAFTDSADGMVRLKTTADTKVVTPTSGSIQGTIDARDQAIKTLQDDVNNLAKELITAINDGYDTGSVPTNGLVAHYPMKGNASESTTNGTNGTVSGATLTTDRAYRTERAYNFDGTNDSISIGNNGLNEKFTIAGWMNLDSAATGANAIYAAGNENLMLKANGDGSITLNVGGSTSYITTDTGKFSTGSWVHVAGSWDGTTARIYINGNSSKEASTSNGAGTLGNPAAGNAYLGGDITNSDDYFKGKIGEMRVYDRALTGAEIDQLQKVKAVAGHKDGKALDGSTGEKLFTGTNAKDVAVNTTLMGNPSKVQAAGAGTTDEPGDNGIVLGLSRLSDSKLDSLGEMTNSQNFSHLTSKFGQELSLVNTQTEEQEAVTRLLARQRESISGVSIDEEIANLMIYQRAFQASAKLISTMDQLMRDVITLR